MTAISPTTASDRSATNTEPQSAIAPDLFTALLVNVGKAAPAESQKQSDGIGRQGAAAASGKRSKKQNGPSTEGAPAFNATNLAVTELATRGSTKATVRAAEAEKVSTDSRAADHIGQGSGSKRTRATDNGSAEPEAGTSRPASSLDRAAQAKSPAQSGPASSAASQIAAQLAPVGPQATGRPGAQAPVAAIGANPAALSRLLQPTSVRAAGPASEAQAAAGRAIVRPVVAHQAQGRAGAKAAQQARPAQQTPDPESEFAAQLGRGFSAIMRQNGGSLTLRLQPQDLGEMTIRMDLQPGKVTAAFEVESEQARQLLDANMTTLRSALEARGLGVESLTVHVSDAGRSTPEALATNPAEPGNHGGANAPNPEGGTPGDRGGTGADRPTADGAIAPARSENQVSPDAGVAPGVEVGGAQVVRLVLDAVA